MQLQGSWDITVLLNRLPTTIELALGKLNVYSSYKPLAYLGSRADELITTHAILVSSLTSQEIDILLLEQKYGGYQLSDIVTVLNANAFDATFVLDPSSELPKTFTGAFDYKQEEDGEIFMVEPIYYLASHPQRENNTDFYALAEISYQCDSKPKAIALIKVNSVFNSVEKDILLTTGTEI
jgi:hypothetical protein